MIPKYIENKIIKHNQFVNKAISLEREIDEWYSKQLNRYEKFLENVQDEEFCEIKCDESASYFSIENIRYNLILLQQLKKGA